MLAIRLQRVGRRGTAVYRVIVQDSHWSPKSGKKVAHLGSYDPHSKTLSIDKEKTEHFLKNGALPSERMVLILKSEGIKLPKWVPKPLKKSSKPKKEKVEKVVKEQPVAAEAGEEKPAQPTGDQEAGPAEAPSEEAPDPEASAEDAAK